MRKRSSNWKRLRGFLLPFLITILVLHGGRFILLKYSMIIMPRERAAPGYEKLRRCLKATSYARLGLWPVWRKVHKGAFAVFLATTGTAYNTIGDFPNALRYIKESMKFAELSEKAEVIALTSVCYADLIIDLDPMMAKEHYLKAFRYYSKIRDLSYDPSIYLRLADCAMAAGDFDNALQHLAKAEAIAEKPDLMIILKRAEVLYRTKRYAEAETTLESVSDWSRPAMDFLLYPKHDLLYPRLKADIQLKMGRYGDDAVVSVFALKPMVEYAFMVNIPDAVMWYARLGWLNENQGKTDIAIKIYTGCIYLLENFRKQIPNGMRMNFFSKEIYSIPYRHLTSIVSDMPPNTPTRKELRVYGNTNFEAALYLAESSKARIFMERIASTGRHTAGYVSIDLKEKEQGLMEAITERKANLEHVSLKGGFSASKIYTKEEKLQFKTAEAPKAVVEAKVLLDQAQQRWKAFEDELYEKYPRYAALNYPRPVPLDKVPLRDDEVILEYALGDSSSHLFLIEKGKRREIVRINLSKDEISSLVRKYMASFSAGDLQPDRDVGKRLYENLLAKALSGINTTKRIVIIPDSALWTLPFEMLPIQKGGGSSNRRSVGDSWNISYYPSLSIMALNRLVPANKPERAFFGVGDAVFKTRFGDQGKNDNRTFAMRGIYIDRAEYEFPPLPETRKEIEEAAKMFGTVSRPPDVLFGDDATETQIKKTSLENYRVLHFATHGIANCDIAGIREPALILTPDSENDGILRASEVVALRLRYPLVILAACKTGLGEEIGGEGVMSMARAFQHAGAKTVIMSLWNIPSKVAQEMFLAFYHHLLEGQRIGQSLKLAKLEVREKYPDPFYWGAFVIVGEAG